MMLERVKRVEKRPRGTSETETVRFDHPVRRQPNQFWDAAAAVGQDPSGPLTITSCRHGVHD